jgi:hypothetical protein
MVIPALAVFALQPFACVKMSPTSLITDSCAGSVVLD